MAIYNSTEFGKLTGKSRSSIETYATRHQVVKNENKKIDTEHPVNALFLEKHSKNKAVQLELKEEPQSTQQIKTNESGASAMMQLEYAVKKLQAQKLQKDISLKDIEIKNKQGQLIEAEKAVNIARNYSEHLRKDFRQKATKLVKDICLRYQIPSTKAAEYTIKIDDLINQCNNSAIEYLNETLNGK